MKTHHSDGDYNKKATNKMQGLTSFPPAIPFEKPPDKKSDSKQDDKDKYKSFDVKIDREDKDSKTVEHTIKVFEEGSPEVYVKWLEAYCKLEAMMPLEKPHHKVNAIRT